MNREEIDKFLEENGLPFHYWLDTCGGFRADVTFSEHGDVKQNILRSLVELVDLLNCTIDKLNGCKSFSVSSAYIEGYIKGYNDSKEGKEPYFTENYHPEFENIIRLDDGGNK